MSGNLVVLHESIHFIPQVCDLKKIIISEWKWVFKFGISVWGGVSYSLIPTIEWE